MHGGKNCLIIMSHHQRASSCREGHSRNESCSRLPKSRRSSVSPRVFARLRNDWWIGQLHEQDRPGSLKQRVQFSTSPYRTNTSTYRTNLSELTTDTLSTISIPSNVVINVSVAKDVSMLTGNPQMLQRLLTNRALNVLPAMPAGEA